MPRLSNMLDQFWLARHLHTGELLLFDPDAPRPSSSSVLLYNLTTRERTQLWENQFAALIEVVGDPQKLRAALESYQDGLYEEGASAPVSQQQQTPNRTAPPSGRKAKKRTPGPPRSASAVSRAQNIRELQEVEERQAAKATERERRRAQVEHQVPEHEEGVPRPDWAPDADIVKIRRGYRH